MSLVYGCTDVAALNFHPGANAHEDGSCVCGGCTVADSLNYDSLATVNDDSCVAAIAGCTDSTALNYRPEFNVLSGWCSIPGCVDPSSVNFNAAATFSDGCSCDDLCASAGRRRLSNSGCLDPSALTFDPSATIFDPFSCEYGIIGCTDSIAVNFLSIATHESEPSSSCVPGVLGVHGRQRLELQFSCHKLRRLPLREAWLHRLKSDALRYSI